jgi:hypothetical protein
MLHDANYTFACTPKRHVIPHHPHPHNPSRQATSPARLEKPPQQTPRARSQHARPEDVVRHVPALLEQHIAALDRQTALLCLRGGSGSDEGVKCGGGQHLRGGVGDVQRHERRAVEFVEVEALDMVVVIYTNFVSLDTDISFLFLWVGDGGQGGACLEGLGCVVARVDRVLVLARVRVHLAAVDFDGVEFQRAVGGFGEFAVLPLDDAFGAFGVRCCGGLAARLEVLVALIFLKSMG